MTKHREILRLSSMGLSQAAIAASCGVSKKSVSKTLKAAREKEVSWPLDKSYTDEVLERLLFPKAAQSASPRKMPDFAYIRRELQRNGVNKKYNGPLVKTTNRKKFVNHSTLVVCGDFAVGGRA